MRDIEEKFVESFLNDKDFFEMSPDYDVSLLLAQPLGTATTDFLTFVQENRLFTWDDTEKFWLQLELYFKASPENQQDMLQQIEQHIEEILIEESHNGKNKESGTYLMEISPQIIQKVYLSNILPLIDLFEKYVPTPTASFFKEKLVPEKIKIRQQEAQETIKKVSLKTLEPFILKAQRYIRGKRRHREELNRIAQVHAKELNLRNMTAEDLMQDANTPYVPQCEPDLSKRIMDAAQKVSAFSTIKHITSQRTIQSVLDDALYGRRTLLDFYMIFEPAALHVSDVLNGDGNVVCLGPEDIDPSAAGSIIIEFDLPKLLQTKPAAFFKQRDLEYSKTKVRQVSLGSKKLYFDHTASIEESIRVPGNTYLKIINPQSRDFTHIAHSLKSTFIAYDLERMHEILTLNFFRFMDKMTKGRSKEINQKYINQFYTEVSRLDDEALVRFLTDIEKNMTDTAEFNFYGAHQINFSTVTSISDRHKGYTLSLPEFLDALTSGELDTLRKAQESLPEVFQSYRFLDYLLTHVKHPEARLHLDDLRKQCKTPDWIQYTPIETKNEQKTHSASMKHALNTLKSESAKVQTESDEQGKKFT